jgi:hypothetical protein
MGNFYFELLTRLTKHRLDLNKDDESSAFNSIHELFG